MPTFEELIQNIHNGSGNVPLISDAEGKKLTIDGYKRTITAEYGFNTQVGITNDYNTNEITFKCPKTVDGHDLVDCKTKVVKWHNISSNMMGSDQVEVTFQDETTFLFTWKIPPEAMTRAGTLCIAVCFCDTEGHNIVYKWNSLTYAELTIGQGMDNIAVAGVPLSDIITVDVRTRKINLPADYNTIIGIQGAPGTSKLTFRVNRFVDDWDMQNTDCSIFYQINEIQKQTIINSQYFRILDSLSGNIEDDWIEFDWVVSSEVFNYFGNLTIAIGFTGVSVEKAWRSKELTSLSIERSIFGANAQIPESDQEGWLFISQEELDSLLQEQYDYYRIPPYFSIQVLEGQLTTYKFDPGMTWQDYINSDYNLDKEFDLDDGGNVHCNKNAVFFSQAPEGWFERNVQVNELIKSYHTYYRN